MPKKRFSAEQIVTLLRQIEVSMAQGKPTPVACRDGGDRQKETNTRRCLAASHSIMS
jgi:putative transposase